MDTKKLIESHNCRRLVKKLLFRYMRWGRCEFSEISQFVHAHKNDGDEKFFHQLHEEFKLRKNVEVPLYWKRKATKHHKKIGKWAFGKTYLDYGGGDGYMAETFGKLIKAETTMVADVAEWSGQKRKPNPAIEFIDVNDMKIPDDSVDIVTAWHVLHHLKNVKSVVSNIKRILKPGGRFIIYEHDIRGPMQDRLIEFQHRIFSMGFDTMTLAEHKKTFTKFRSQPAWNKIIGMKLLKIVRPRTEDYSYYAVYKKI